MSSITPDEETHTRYHRLTEKKGSKGGKTNSSGRKQAGSGQKIANPGMKKGQAGSAPIDDHSLWGEVREAGVLGRWLVQTAVRDAFVGLTPEQQDRIPGALRQQIEQVSRSNDSRTEELATPAVVEATISWGYRLRQFVRHATEPRPNFHRPPRRFPTLLGIVPAQSRRPQRARVMAVIDTSGSISPETLKQINAELEQIRRRHDVVIVECDATIQAIYPMTGPLVSVRGRGGTDLRPPFQPEILRKIRPDVMIYFTDGCGPAPIVRPSTPVIWCLTPHGERPTSWGWELRMMLS